jgi:phosphonate transport system substrate-binding protein
MNRKNRVGLTVAALIVAVSVMRSTAAPLGPFASMRTENEPVRIGAVAYSPSVVTVFSELKRYLSRNDFPSDFVLYSNYDALVAALERKEIDIAWNTPLAHAQYHVQSGGTSQTLVMRDVDCNVRSVLVVRSDSGIETPKDLAGKRLVLGSRDAAEATVLPVHYLEKEKVELGRVNIVSLDKEVDFKGNPCCSPSHVLQAVREGRGDAGIITESLWRQAAADKSGTVQLKQIWTSPSFSHCVFTAGRDFDAARARRFTQLMTAMDANQPGCADILRLEGAKRWVPGTSDGFADLVEALRQR